jgi:hypothetical protein
MVPPETILVPFGTLEASDQLREVEKVLVQRRVLWGADAPIVFWINH